MIAFAPQVGTRGRGHLSPAARCILPLLALVLAACGQQSEVERAANASRTIATDGAPLPAAECATLPDTTAELIAARIDMNDLPDTRLELDDACPRLTVLIQAGARIQRTYRVRVKAGHTLVARARGEVAPVALAFDYPATPKADSSNFGRLVVDSIRVTQDSEIAVRVMLIPKLRVDPNESRVLLTVLVRP